MKRIIFVASIEDWTQLVSLPNWEDYKECVTFNETEESINNDIDDNIVTTSLAHLNIGLIQEHDVNIYREGRIKKIQLGRKLSNGCTLNEFDNLLELFKLNLL
jgi:hypothetical protein